MTEPLALVPVQNPHRGAFLAERTALAIRHLSKAKRLCEALEAVGRAAGPSAVPGHCKAGGGAHAPGGGLFAGSANEPGWSQVSFGGGVGGSNDGTNPGLR